MRRAGVAHSGQGALVWVDRTRRVICAVVASTSQAARRSTVASGTKRAKLGCRGVETKAGSFYQGWGLWGHGASVAPPYQGCLMGMQIYTVEAHRMPSYATLVYHQKWARTVMWS